MNLANKYVSDKESKKPIRIAITMDGGIIQNVLCDVPAEVVIMDYDTDDCDDEELVRVFNTVAAHRELDAEINDADMNVLFNAVKNP